MAYKDKSNAIKYNNQFIRESYDRINLTVAKGRKETIQIAAAAQGQSVNAYITQAITERMERDSAELPNDETIAAMEELENGGGEHFTGSTEDFFRYLSEGEDE